MSYQKKLAENFYCKEGLILLLLFLFPLIQANAQQHDNVILQTVEVVYDYDYDTISYIESSALGRLDDGNITMCDSVDNLIFYSNGLNVFGKDNLIMKYGDSIDFTGLYSDTFQFYSYPFLGALHIGYYQDAAHSNPIPLPGQKDQYLWVHHPKYFESNLMKQKAFYTRIDMQSNDGHGAVIEKNVELPMNSACAEFCKHANGVDWWLIGADPKIDTFYIFLINEDGIKMDSGFMHHLFREFSGITQSEHPSQPGIEYFVFDRNQPP